MSLGGGKSIPVILKASNILKYFDRSFHVKGKGVISGTGKIIQSSGSPRLAVKWFGGNTKTVSFNWKS